MKIILIMIIFISVNAINAQSEIKNDTLYDNNEKRTVKGYGKIKDGKRIGTWHFNGNQEDEHTKLTYLGDSSLYYQLYFDNKIRNITYLKSKDSIIVKEGINAYFTNGNLEMLFFYMNDKLNGDAYVYYPSLSIKKKRFYVNDTLQGTATDYYENGIVESIGNIVDGAKSGIWVSYYSDGIIKSEGKYTVINTDEVNEEGLNKILQVFFDNWITLNSLEVKDGKWKYFSENGKLLKEEFWEKGILKETKEYDEEGNLIKK